MILNGNLQFHTLGSGEIQNAIIERLAGGAAGVSLPAGVAGRMAYNTTDNTYYFHNGTAWTPFSTGGDATALQNEVNKIEATLGNMIDAFGDAVTANMNSLSNVTGASTISQVLFQLDAAISGSNQLSELTDVTITAVATGEILKFNGSVWINNTLAEAGIQPLDTALTNLSALSGTGFVVQSAADTFLTTTLLAGGTGLQGIAFSDASGIADAPTIGLSISGLTAEAGTLSGTDTVALFDGVNNVKASVTQLKAGIVADGIPLGSLSDVTNSLSGSLVTTTSQNAYFFTASTTTELNVTAATLGALNNVAAGVDAAPTGDVLAFDGAEWTAITVTTMLGDGVLNDLKDVTITAVADKNILYYDAGGSPDFGWRNGAAGATSGVQPYDAGLAALAASTGTGFLVQTGNDTFTNRSIATASSARVTVTNGSGVAGDATLDLALVTNGGGGTFRKLAIDGYGRVTDTSAVVALDITTLVDATYVNVSGDTMTGHLNFGTAVYPKITDMPLAATDAANKAYVDQVAAAGATWRNPVVDPDLVDVVSAIPTPGTDTTYIKFGGTQNETWGAVTNVVNNDVLTYDGAVWSRMDTLNAGDRFIIAGEHGTIGATLSGVGFVNDDLIQYVSGNPGLFASWTTPEGRGAGPGTEIAQGVTVLVSDPESLHYGHTYLYDAIGNTWREIAGPGSISAGTGLYYSGNILNVGLGAGIVELPSDEVGIDLYATAGLWLTTDEISASTAAGAKLALHLDGSTLSQSATGVKVATGGITATQLNASVAGDGISGGGGTALAVDYVAAAGFVITGGQLDLAAIPNGRLANSSITVQESGAVNPQGIDLGGTLTFVATSATGVSVSTSVTDTVTIAGITATSTVKGVATFNTASFLVTAGDVTIKTGGVSNAQLVNSAITLAAETGSGSVSLGGTLTITGGVGIDTSASGSTTTVTLNARAVDLTDVDADATLAGQILVAGTPVGTPAVSSYTPRKIQFVYSGTSATSHVVTHNLSQQYCNVTVVDSTDQVVIPQSITFNTANQLTVVFNTAIACKVVVMGVAGIGLN